MTVWINEFHYDNTGTDTGEFIEVAGVAGTDLSGYSIVLYNGNGGAVYDTDALSGVIANQSNGFGTVSIAYPSNGIQNGSPDAIALVGPGNTLIQFLSYEGAFTGVGGIANGVTSTNIGISQNGSEAAGSSLALTGTGSSYADFVWAADSNDTPGAVNNGQSFTGAPAGATVSVADVSITEGNSGTQTLTFTVTRSDATTAFSIDYATADSTASAASDYLATSGTLSFAVSGALTQTVSVTINGDTMVETTEAFAFNLSNLVTVTGTTTIGDGAATGTITNDDLGVPITAINVIQGAGHRSTLVGQTVTTTGIVTAVDSNGYYLQTADADVDASIATSEAIFVFTSSTPTVAVGQAINVSGTVSEFTPGGASTGNLSTTQIGSVTATTILSSGNALPTAIVLGAGGRQLPTSNIDDDGLTSFDPTTDGVDFYESLEAMLVTVPTPRAVSATNGFGEIYTVADNGAAATNLTPRGSIIIEGTVGDGLNVTNTGAGSDFNPERIQIDPDSTVTPGSVPLVDVGAILNDVTGVIGYNFGNFEVIPTAQVTVRTASTLARETTALTGNATTITVAAYNVLNLDPVDNDGNSNNVAADADVANGRFAAIAAQIVNNLGGPDVVALQEVNDNSGTLNDGTIAADVTLQMLVDAIVAAGGPTYSFIDNSFITDGANGGVPGGNIRNAFLYNDARVDLKPGSVMTTPDAATDFVGSRPPLVATFVLDGEELTVINNHFSSKGGSTPLYGVTQPSVNGSAADRLVQAQNVADFVAGLPANTNVVVVGDLNEFHNEESLAPLFAAGLTDLGTLLADDERYSFIFDGNAQALDQSFASASLDGKVSIDIVHVNTEFGFTNGTASDHDPSVLAIDLNREGPVYTLQLLHFADAEAGLLASTTAKFLAANVDRFEDQYANSITLAGGDNFIPGPFLAAGTDNAVRTAINTLTGSTMTGTVPIAAADIALHNLIGVQASSIGNHEFDLGSNVFRNSFTANSGWVGAAFPHISANLDFSLDSDLSPRVVAGGQEASTINGRIAPTAIITEGGERIGLVGVTTQILEAISSPSGTEVLGFPGGPGANGEVDNMTLLAAQIQPLIDGLIAQGVNKIVLMSHLQILNNERTLATLLNGVDIILAAGSNTRLGDADDTAVTFPGHSANFADTYPIVTAGADGKTTVIVNTDNEFTYLGRLVVDFDANGEIITQSLTDNVAINGAYASTAETVADAWNIDVADVDAVALAAGTRGGNVEALTDAVQGVINVKDSNVFGFASVYLNGERISVRNQETNLGNLTADANGDALKDALGAAAPAIVVSLKNGGGIRAQIGSVSAPDPIDGTVDLLGPGTVSQLDIENSLRFNNGLMAFDTTAAGLKAILEHGVANLGNQGRFPQLGGVSFSFDPDLAAGSRILDIALLGEDGGKIALVNDGVVLSNVPATITVVTLNFLANGGDSYPIKANGQNFRYLLNDGTLSAPVDEALNFTATGVVPVNILGEQQALGEFLAERHPTEASAYNIADTAIAQDTRIQNLNFRDDTVLSGPALQAGTTGDDTLRGTNGDDIIDGAGGNDNLTANAGNDIVNGGAGNDVILGARGADTLIGGAGNDVLQGGLDADSFLFSTINNGAVDIITDFNIASGDSLDLGAGVTIIGASVGYATTDAVVNGFNVANSAGSLDLVLTLSSAAGTQTVHILDAYGFGSNEYWEGVTGLDLTYPQPLPAFGQFVAIA